jgi:hypothetical protein
MLNITIATIPHAEQRYPTVGDWIVDPTPEGLNVHIRVSKLSDWRRELLVAVHELVEVSKLAWQHGPKWLGEWQEKIDAFDKQFERDRADGLHSPTAEPGDHPDAPYQYEHFCATTIERMLCQTLGVDWADYDREVGAL